MTTWAQIVDGKALNIVTVDPATIFTDDWLERHPAFLEVPDGTLNGAADNGDGTFTNPVTIKPAGRNLRKLEFLDVGLDTDATKMNAVLLNMPLVSEYLSDFSDVPGIIYGDLTNTSSRLYKLVNAAKTAGLIDDAFVTSFMSNWAALYPG